MSISMEEYVVQLQQMLTVPTSEVKLVKQARIVKKKKLVPKQFNIKSPKP